MGKVEDLAHKIADLKHQKQELITDLKYPEISGTIRAEFVRCGKKNCKCVHGELHGPYYYLYRSEGNVLKKSYICSVNKHSTLYHEIKTSIENAKHNKELRLQISLINKQILALEKKKLDLEDYENYLERRTES
ncbi:MAG: DUF6788 family protein [Candidatus Helarchaeota archaeon]